MVYFLSSKVSKYLQTYLGKRKQAGSNQHNLLISRS